jgi:hypothetical protein
MLTVPGGIVDFGSADVFLVGLLGVLCVFLLVMVFLQLTLSTRSALTRRLLFPVLMLLVHAPGAFGAWVFLYFIPPLPFWWEVAIGTATWYCITIALLTGAGITGGEERRKK